MTKEAYEKAIRIQESIREFNYKLKNLEDIGNCSVINIGVSGQSYCVTVSNPVLKEKIIELVQKDFTTRVSELNKQFNEL